MSGELEQVHVIGAEFSTKNEQNWCQNDGG